MEQNDLIEALSEPYYTNEERDWIKATFKGNVFALKTLRKFFIPSLNNKAPIGQLDDMWVETADLLAKVAPGDRELMILSRIKTIQHIENVLGKLRVLAEVKELSQEQITEQKRLDSTK